MDQTQSAVRGDYAPRQSVTDDDIVRADAALEKTGGHRAHAAIMLKISEVRLNNIVLTNERMREKWGRHKRDIPDGPVDQIHREPRAVSPFSSEDIRAVSAIEKQDTLLKKSWASLGLTDTQKDFLQNLQIAYATNLKGTLDLTYGGMVHAYTKLLFVFEDLQRRIEDIDENPEKYERVHTTEFGQNTVKSAHEFRCELYDRLISISGELRKVNSDATKANWVRAQLEKLKNDSGEKGTRKKKPGWGKVVTVTPTADADPEETP